MAKEAQNTYKLYAWILGGDLVVALATNIAEAKKYILKNHPDVHQEMQGVRPRIIPVENRKNRPVKVFHSF
jgi:hypothetical protein